MFHKNASWLATLLAIVALVAFGATQAPLARAQTPPAEEHEEMPELEPVSLGEGEKLRVVATTNIVADIVLQVGGEEIELTSLLPIGSDPHTYVATPQDVAAVAEAHVVFANGAGLEKGFLDELVKNAGGNAPVVYLSYGVELRHLEEEQVDTHQLEEEHKGVDPHTWTTPANAIVFARNIEEALSALDPAGAETYKANAASYEAQLGELDAWVKEQVETIPEENRKLVTDHAAFGYYADRYGLEQIGAVIPGFSTAAEPSAKELAALEDAIREYGVKAIFVGTSVNPSLSQRVAEDTGVKLVTLYTGSLGPEGSGVETYIDYIRYNTTAIVEALR